MSNFFEEATNNLSGLQERLLGEQFDYAGNIKSPPQLGISGKGDRIQQNVDGLQSYITLLFQGGGDASKQGGPMGKQFFLKTGAKCRDKKSGEQVTRSIYINNIPIENTPLTAGFNLIFGGAQGLIPGILNNAQNINPMGIFGAFMAGTNPDCMAVTLPTRNVRGRVSKETQYMTVDDVKNLSPCLFENKRNPVSNRTADCISGFENIEDEKDYSHKLKIFDHLFDKNNELFKSEDVIAYIYILSLILMVFYLSKK
jgi:uncharacterized protein YozE (UPF0346 family)